MEAVCKRVTSNVVLITTSALTMLVLSGHRPGEQEFNFVKTLFFNQ